MSTARVLAASVLVLASFALVLLVGLDVLGELLAPVLILAALGVTALAPAADTGPRFGRKVDR